MRNWNDAFDQISLSESARETVGSALYTQLSPEDYLALGQNQVPATNASNDDLGSITFSNPYEDHGDPYFDTVGDPDDHGDPHFVSLPGEPLAEDYEQLLVEPDRVPKVRTANPGTTPLYPDSAKPQPRPGVAANPFSWSALATDLVGPAWQETSEGKQGDLRAPRATQPLPLGLEFISTQRLRQVMRDVASALDGGGSSQMVSPASAATAPPDLNAAPKR